MKILFIDFMNFLVSEIITNLILNFSFSFFFNKEIKSAFVLKNAWTKRLKKFAKFMKIYTFL
jgi:hypothetical protein